MVRRSPRAISVFQNFQSAINLILALQTTTSIFHTSSKPPSATTLVIRASIQITSINLSVHTLLHKQAT
jgi:hypothetical protein